ncbi:MAG: TSUP family transporter [Planctomycetota bacterium]
MFGIPLPIIFAVTGAVAGFVDAVAGGGGLITIPVLLAAGIDPKMALGTNKFQASFGSSTAMVTYSLHKHVVPWNCKLGIAATALGAASGALAVQHLPGQFLAAFIPIALLGVLVYFLLAPRAGQVQRQARMPRPVFFLLFGLGIGFYDGFFGPGTGSFWTFAIVHFLGLALPAAAGHTKVMNFTSNIVSLVFFAIGGYVLVVPGLAMATGQIIGARVGAGLASKRGAGFIRPVFLVVVALTIANLLYRRLAAWLGW